MSALWFLERLGEWPHAVILVVSLVAWFVVAFGHGFANKLGELVATDAWRRLGRRVGQRVQEGHIDEND